MKKIKLKRKVNKVKKENITTSQFKKNWQKGNIFEKVLIVIMLLLVGGFACGLAFFIYVVIAAPNLIHKVYIQKKHLSYLIVRVKNLQDLVLKTDKKLHTMNFQKYSSMP